MDVEWRIDELEKQGQDQALLLNDLQSTVMGPPPNRNNGLRGELKSLNEKVDESIKLSDVRWNVKRKEECYGMLAVKELEDKIMTKLKENNELNLAKLNLKGVYLMGTLQFIGMIVVALIAAGVFKK